jgi:hypothetical protein
MNKLKALTSKEFWEDALLRGIRTFFQAALAFIGIDIISITEIDYVGAGALGAGAALLSISQSIVRVATKKIEEEPYDSYEQMNAFESDEQVIEEVVAEAVQQKLNKD